MSLIAGVLSLFLWDPCPGPDAWLGGERAPEDARQEFRAVAQATCRAAGASRRVCTMLDEVGVRESDHDRCAVHVQGRNEYGRGLHGLSVKWQAWRWDGDPMALHDPRVSTIIVLRLWRHGYRTGARTPLDLQRVYGGFRERVGMVEQNKRDRSWCRRLRRRGIDCTQELKPGELGARFGVTPYPTQTEDLRALPEK